MGGKSRVKGTCVWEAVEGILLHPEEGRLSPSSSDFQDSPNSSLRLLNDVDGSKVTSSHTTGLKEPPRTPDSRPAIPASSTFLACACWMLSLRALPRASGPSALQGICDPSRPGGLPLAPSPSQPTLGSLRAAVQCPASLSWVSGSV